MTVLDYLRDVAARTGTKEGCAEGDCGACTVALGSLEPHGCEVRYRAVNSCIRFLPTIELTGRGLAGGPPAAPAERRDPEGGAP